MVLKEVDGSIEKPATTFDLLWSVVPSGRLGCYHSNGANRTNHLVFPGRDRVPGASGNKRGGDGAGNLMMTLVWKYHYYSSY